MGNKYFKKIANFYKSHRRMPSQTEIAELVGFKSRNAAFKLVQKLIAEKLADKDKTGRLIPRAGLFGGVPLFSNPVEAGWPSPAEEELIDTITLDEYLIPNKEATITAPVRGDSMKDAGIIEGDIVIIERNRPYDDGDIVIVSIDREFTIKYYRKKGKEIFFEPANEKYKPIYPKLGQEIKIIGVVIGTFRKYR